MPNLAIPTIFRALVLAGSFSLLLSAQAQEPSVQRYASENGRNIKVASTGNLIGLEAPGGFEHIDSKRAREGYVLAYSDPFSGASRVLHDVFDRYSTTIKVPFRDFQVVSYSSSPVGVLLNLNDQVTATSVVETRDGLLRLTHVLNWKAGTGTVTVTTTVTNISGLPLLLRSFKRHIDVDLDSAGPYGAAHYQNSIVTDPGLGSVLIFNGSRCYPQPFDSPICPPRPLPINLVAASNHLMQISGNPLPTHTIVKDAGDDGELTSALPGPSLIGRRDFEDNQVTLAWMLNQSLNPGASKSFAVTYQVN